MVPGKNDPRWKSVVASTTEYPLSGLATKMLIMRVRTMTKMDSSPAKVDEAIAIAHDFFSKNLETAKADIEVLFGK